MADPRCSDADSRGTEGDLDPTTVRGVKSLQRLFPLLQRLAPAGTERDVAGHRQLLFSQ